MITFVELFSDRIEFLEIIIKVRQFYNTEEEFKRIYAKLKLHTCPHCNLCGFLILHGYLYGYSENISAGRIKRGHRIFCSNRKKKNGCGKTFSILVSTFIKNFVISAKTVWIFLNKIKGGICLSEAFRYTGSSMVESTCYRILKTFKYNQDRIRTLLTKIKGPPQMPNTKKPALQTIMHLKSVFERNSCPISQFQYHFQVSFF